MALTHIVRGGTVYDGSGGAVVRADVGIEGDRVVQIDTDLPDAPGAEVVDATGLAVTPGFVNVLSHAWGSLQQDSSGASDLLQGVTTEVFGEALSLGPSDERFSDYANALGAPEDIRVVFDRLGDGLDHLVGRGVAPNVASFVGGHNLRILGAGFDDRPLTGAELDRLRGLVDEEMSDGALGIGTALIYPPGRFARTDELTELCRVVGRHGGTYISHLRSEGDQFLECLEELIGIGRNAECSVENYHLKAAGRHNWHKMQLAIDRIQQARDEGQPVTADMYPYTAGGTALAAAIPPQFHVGGPEALMQRLDDPAVRREVVAALHRHSDDFENLFLAASEGTGVVFSDDVGGLQTSGHSLVEVAAQLGLDDAAEALVEVVRRARDASVLYFIADEANVELGLQQPWVSIGSDAAAQPATPPFTDEGAHPRSYGTFARFLGHYVRDRGVTSFAEAIRRMTSLPASTLGLASRGTLAPGSYADVVVLDSEQVRDRATYEQPHQYAEGVRHVLVNGEAVVREGEVTQARPGRRVRRGIAA
jgi:N-acyl-D-amino-acid deacylase